AVGGTATYIVTANVSPSATGTLVNTATVAPPSGTSDPNLGNNSATDTDNLTPQADLSVVKTGPATAVPGNNVSYTLTGGNGGHSPAVTVSLGDPLPAGTTFVSLAPAAGWGCVTPPVGGTGTVTCSIASIAPGAPSSVFTLVVALDPSFLGANLSNTATV